MNSLQKVKTFFYDQSYFYIIYLDLLEPKNLGDLGKTIENFKIVHGHSGPLISYWN